MDTNAILLLILIAAVLVIGLRIAKSLQTSSSQTPATLVAPQFDIGPILDAVKAGVDKDGIASAVRVAVEAEVRKTAQEALAANNEQTKSAFDSQRATMNAEAKALLTPFETEIKQLKEQIENLRTDYTKEHGTINSLASQLSGLQDTTTSLRNALKSPTARGSWGENQLRNVVRLAGMENYCDFTEQFTGTENERNQRPDVVIKLPTGGRIAVDSKAPLSAYMRMQEANDVATQDAELKQHSKDLRAHMRTLAEKKYWDQFGHNTPDFVVMFIPGEGFLADALKADTTLLDDAMQSRVLVASPVNLLALLLTVAKGWQSHHLNEQAEVVAKLGSELYERVGKVLDEVIKMGRAIGTTNTAYNDMVASLEGRLLVTLRRFKELGVVQENAPIAEISPVDKSPRQLMSPEAQGLSDSDDGN